MRYALQLSLLAATAAAALATAARADPFTSVFVGPKSDFANQSCNGPTGPAFGTTYVERSVTCSRGDVGTATAAALAATGHLAGGVIADTHNGDSLSAGNGASANFIDFLTFAGGSPGGTATVVANLELDGHFEALVNAGGDVRAFLSMAGQDYDFRYFFSTFDSGVGSNNWRIDGTPGQFMHLSLHSAGIVVPLNSPVQLRMILEVGAGASGPGAHAVSEFGLHSFKLAPTPFDLPEGVTVNAGDYIVDNHFIDPLAAGGVPEPASWALTIGGFGVAGGLLRRRKPATA